MDESLFNQEAAPRSLESYYTKPHNPEGSSYPVRMFDYAKKLPRALWLVATEVEIKNKRNDANYLDLHVGTKRLAREAAVKFPDIRDGPARQLYRTINETALWRKANGYDTYVVLEPPPLAFVSLWEKVFSDANIRIAWLDNNDEAQPCNYTPPISRAEERALGRESTEFEAIATLDEGEAVRFLAMHGADKTTVRSRLKMYEKLTVPAEVARYRSLARKVAVSMGYQRSFVVSFTRNESKKQGVAKWVIVRRRTEDDHRIFYEKFVAPRRHGSRSGKRPKKQDV